MCSSDLSQQTGCTGRDTVIINVSPLNIAGFTYTATLGNNFSFTNTSGGGTIYSWDFGDGTSDTAANPVHIYNTTGVYNVTLITGNGVCPNDTITQQITVVVIGIEENGALSLLPVYPNPAQDFISTSMVNHESSVRILIQDAVGRMMLQTSSDQ